MNEKASISDKLLALGIIAKRAEEQFNDKKTV
jgi:hypothetical protein